MTAGRPRAFDLDEALDRALHVFWKKGYDGASIPDLTKAMGINRPSLYAAFGNKEALFHKALDRYAEGPASYVREALNEPTARAVFERLLQGAADLLSSPKHPPGCLIVHAALTCAEASNPIRKALASRRQAAQRAIRVRFERAKLEGDLPSEISPAELARYVSTVMHGMSVQAASGATRKELRSIAKTALRAWPR